MDRVRVDVITLIPSVDRQCAACEAVFDQTEIGQAARRQTLHEYPPAIIDEYARISTWLRQLPARYGDRVRLRVIDPRSGLGIWKSLRHRVRRYPTFIIDDRVKLVGWDEGALEEQLQRVLGSGHDGAG